MSIIKKIVAGKMEVVDTSCDAGCRCSCSCSCSFPKGTKFSIDGKDWIVSLAEKTDNVEFRTIVNTSNGEEEIRTLKSLLQDVKDGVIKI